MSPEELSNRLYKEGVEKIRHQNFVSTTIDIGKLD